MRTLPRGYWAACAGVFLVGVLLRLIVDSAVETSTRSAAAGPETHARLFLQQLESRTTAERTGAVYSGLGVWVDAFDFSPTYARSDAPPVAPETIDEFAAVGVRTIYLQAARPDARSPGRLLEEDVLGEFLIRAHAHGIRVVGWYLPTFENVGFDLDRLLAVAEFEVLGHRFDGVAVDIEFTEAVPDHTERSARLVELSERLRAARPGEALGAIVQPPVLFEVINTQAWPRFPWRALEPSYDVWLPMAYWTGRTTSSGYRDAYRYTEESTRRMRNNIGRQVVVHPIGGIGDALAPGDLDDFRRALIDTASIGGSIYDWNSMSEADRAAMAELVPG